MRELSFKEWVAAKGRGGSQQRASPAPGRVASGLRGTQVPDLRSGYVRTAAAMIQIETESGSSGTRWAWGSTGSRAYGSPSVILRLMSCRSAGT